ncbi:MAG: dihydrolipoamide acetyltransferase family protein [Anaerolineales bacterium]
MTTPVIMPKFEMAQESGTIVRWLYQEGNPVKKGEPLLEVETDKVVMEVDAPASGILKGVCAREGDRVPVTEVIAFIAQSGEELLEIPRQGYAETPLSEKPPGRQNRRLTPLAQRIADERGIDINAIPISGTSPWIRRRDVERYKTFLAIGGGERKKRATPAARRAARESGVDLRQVNGSGPRERVQEADVRAASESPTTEPRVLEILPLKGIRRTIAERMQSSYQTAPHITLTVEVDMTEAESVRRSLNERADLLKVTSIPVTAFLVKVCAWALRRHPRINAALRDEEIYVYEPANIGVAVALEEGLIVPVIQRADKLGLAEIAARLEELQERAHQGRLGPQDVHGGTFTISNLGMFGIDQFTAILNPPESGILAIGRIVKRPIAVETRGHDEVVIRAMMRLTLSADHRVIDGAVAARFLQDVVAALENPNLLLW